MLPAFLLPIGDIQCRLFANFHASQDGARLGNSFRAITRHNVSPSCQKGNMPKLTKSSSLLIKMAVFLDFLVGGAEGIRTPDPHNAIVVLYQLSYDPNQGAERRERRRPARLCQTFCLRSAGFTLHFAL